VGLPFFYSRQYDKAIEQFQRVLQLDPDFYPANFYLALASVEVGHYKDAIKIFNKLKRVNDGPDLALCLGYAHARAGQKKETQKILRSLLAQLRHGYVPAYDIALTYAQLGQSDPALVWLDKAYKDHELSYLIKVEPMLDPLRGDARFQALLRRTNLAD
jgi:tetratricopeptide (TPR) repeat protein